MHFTESNTVEQMILDAATSLGSGAGSSVVREDSASAASHPAGWGGSLGAEFAPSRWTYMAATALPRQPGEVMVEPWVREALIFLNPEIAEQPDRADEVIYALRAILLSVQGDGLVRANENFMAWLRGEKTMPFGPNGEHTPVRLIDFNSPSNNRLTVTNQWVYSRTGALTPDPSPTGRGVAESRGEGQSVAKRFDVVFLVNGLPLVIGEAKTLTRSAVTWFDGAYQVNEIYEKEIPAMFVPNVFSFATEGRCLRYGSIRMPIDLWGPWRDEEHQEEGNLGHVRTTVESLMRPGVVLDILQNFTLFATDKKHRRIKVICRYQQYETTNKMVARVVAGYPKKGLIWHFQGSGKSLLMVFAAQKLRMHPRLGNPTVLIVVDRIDLDTQISATFNAADVPNMVGVGDRQELQRLINQDVRKVLITTIHKFGEATGEWNARKNIIVMVDEAHRTQEGDLGRKMREALPNAFLFGLTGTPINRADRNTFWAFGADEDSAGYMSRYSFQDSIRDKATLPLHFEAPTVKLKIDKAAIDEAFKQITDDMSEQDRDDLAKRAAKMAVLVKNPERVRGRGGAHRAALPVQGGAERLQGAGRVLRPRVLRALQDRDGRDHRSRGKRHRDEQRPEGPARLERPPARQGRRGEAAGPLPRSGGPAEVCHRDQQAAHRLRRADPPGDVSRQADEGPQPPSSHLPRESHLWADQDSRADRGLHRDL